MVEDVSVAKRFVRFTLDTKLVLLSMVGLLALGTSALLFTERANTATLGGMEALPRLLNAFFMSSAARTGGFASINVGSLTEDGLVVLMALMFIGGASASTAGGIKVQTFSHPVLRHRLVGARAAGRRGISPTRVRTCW